MGKILYLLPGLVGCGIIARFGLLGTVAVLILELPALIIWKDSKRHDGLILMFSTLGVVAGYLLYPVTSSPTGLGVAVLILTLLVHGVLYLMLAGFQKNK